MNPRRKNEAGFTIFEVLVVTIIFSLLAAITAPSFSTVVSAHRLTAGLRKSINAIRVARSAAISRNVQARIVVSGDGKTLSVEADRPGVGWSSIGTPVVLDGGVTVSAVSPANGLTFTTDGRVTNSVTVTLQNNRGDTKQISVSLLGGVSAA